MGGARMRTLNKLLKRAGFMLLDALFLQAAILLAAMLNSYLLKLPSQLLPMMGTAVLPLSCLCVAVFAAFGVYRNLWLYISAGDLFRITGATVIVSFLSYVYFRLLGGYGQTPGIGVMVFYLQLTLSAGVRLLPAVQQSVREKLDEMHHRQSGKRTLIVGAGESAAALIKSIRAGKERRRQLVAAVDDARSKQGQSIRGVPILGGCEMIPAICEEKRVQEILIAIPSATPEQLSRIVNICTRTGRKTLITRGVAALDAPAQSVSLRDIDVNDLLGRPEVALDDRPIASYIKGARVLVTGGGGSIGSELCRQIMRCEPAALTIYDFYENNAYDIQQELIVSFPHLAGRLCVRIGSVQDEARLDAVFAEAQPELVFHAAAYKHVPLMEEEPALAIRNNVYGTNNVALAARRHGARRFVMISTDKAVNPTNVMGASKRLAELVVQSHNGRGTEFVAVRFGNVLNSNGSVVPLFKRQIEHGGPVRLTHPDIIRYFMTIPEAARLVLSAGAMAKGGEIFILDMGTPIKILDLARSMIAMAGYVPDKDIAIEYTGLRPGEKLYEELLTSEEGIQKTANRKIYIARPHVVTESEREAMLRDLNACMSERGDIRAAIQRYVPGYRQCGPAKTEDA